MSLEVKTLGEVIGERILTLAQAKAGSKEVRVLIGKPQNFPDSRDYFCPFQILGLGDEKIRYAGGFDSIQAIQIALQMIALELHVVHRAQLPNLTWVGNTDIGFPLVESQAS